MKQLKKSLKPIPLSLRDKKRYVSFTFAEGGKFSEKEVREEVNRVFYHLFGEIGLARKNFQFVSFNEKTQKGILKCRHTEVEDVKAGVLFVKEIGGKPVLPGILRVSGSIGKLKK